MTKYVDLISYVNFYLGDVCYKGHTKSLNHICRDYHNCPQIKQEIDKGRKPPICSFHNNTAVICCPPDSSHNLTPNNGSSSNRPPNNRLPKPKPTIIANTTTTDSYSAVESM